MNGRFSNKKFIVSGDQVMLDRHYLFIDCFREYFNDLVTVSTPSLSLGKRKLISETLKGFPLIDYFSFPKDYDQHKSSWSFDYKSAKLYEAIKKEDPDFVLHIFGMSCPIPKSSNIPYAVTLDYTTALAERSYPEWARFPNKKEREKWLKREVDSYKRASFLFPWSNPVAESLQKDYGISSEKMVVTGSSGNLKPSAEIKSFGSCSLLMNGSDFFRKGGDIAVKAFKVVQEKLPQATLQIVGVAEGPKADNVFYKGNVSSKEEIAKMFLNADIVLGPARCDPYPGFIVEAMGFGTPCIVSDRDGMPEIVDNGINGIVLQQLDEASLATAIIDLLPDLDKLKRFSAAAKNKVVTQLNWERLARIIVDKCVPD